MTGPEHYAEAEQTLDSIEWGDSSSAYIANLITDAQVHATLALAAASALPPQDGARYAWLDVAGIPVPTVAS